MAERIHKARESGRQVRHLGEIAETLWGDALAAARNKLGIAGVNQSLTALFKRGDFVDYFKYELATRTARELAANDERVHAIYIYDPSSNPDCEAGIYPSIDMSVHLLVQVSIPSAALETFIDSLDSALTATMKELLPEIFERRNFILNATIISEQDVKLRRGYAALLSSLFAPPLKIWQR